MSGEAAPKRGPTAPGGDTGSAPDMGAPAPGGDMGGAPDMGAPAPGGDMGGAPDMGAPAGREKRESVDYSRRLGILLNSKKK